jgi:hypothetical protein
MRFTRLDLEWFLNKAATNSMSPSAMVLQYPKHFPGYANEQRILLTCCRPADSFLPAPVP